MFPLLFLLLPWDSYDFATLRRQSECTESLKNRFVPRPLHTYGWCWWLAWLAWTNFVGWVNSLYRKLLVDRMKNGPVPSYCGPRPPNAELVMMKRGNNFSDCLMIKIKTATVKVNGRTTFTYSYSFAYWSIWEAEVYHQNHKPAHNLKKQPKKDTRKHFFAEIWRKSGR